MDEDPIVQPLTNDELNADLGTPAPQPVGPSDIAVPPEMSASPDDPVRRVGDSITQLQQRPQDMTGTSEMMRPVSTLGEERRYRGKGEPNLSIKPEHVDALRKNQNDPDAVAAFDVKYGEGASTSFLTLPKKEHIDALRSKRNDEEAVEAFNAIYGPGMANLYATLYDADTNPNQRYQAAVAITNILTGVEESPKKSLLGEIGSAIFSGAAKGLVQEPARSLGLLDPNGPTYDRSSEEGVNIGINDYPITSGIIEGVTQFVAPFLVGGAVIRPTEAAGALGTVTNWSRAFGLGYLVDMFAMSPDDPLLKDNLKKLATFFGQPDMDLSWLPSVKDFDSEWEKRKQRGLEGGVAGTAIEAVLKMVAVGFKAAKNLIPAKPVEAVPTPDDLAQARMANATGLPDTAVQGELPLGNMLDGDQAAQVRMDRGAAAGRFDASTESPADAVRGLPGTEEAITTTREPMLPMDLPRELNNAPSARQGGPVLNAEDQALRDLFGVTEPVQLDLGVPKPDGLPANGQGLLFGEGMPMQSPPPRGGAVEASIPTPAPSKTATRMETLENALTPRTPEERNVLKLIENPTPTPPNLLQKLIGDIPDLTFTRNSTGNLVAGMTDTSFGAVRRAIEPFVDDVIKISQSDPDALIRYFNRSNTPDEVEKFAAVVNAAVRNVTDEIGIVDAKLAALEKAGRKAEASLLLKSEGTPLVTLKSKLDKVDRPLGTMAAQMLARRNIESRLTAAVRVRSAELRAKGISDRDIITLVADAIDNSKIDFRKVDTLTKQRDIAFKQGDTKAVERLDKELTKILDNIEKQSGKNLESIFTRVTGVLAEIKTTNILSGQPTLLINLIAPPVSYAVRNAGAIVGATVSQGFRIDKGLKLALSQQRARAIGLAVGERTKRRILLDIAESVLREDSKMFSNDLVNPGGSAYINAARLGIDPTSKIGIGVNIAGKVQRAQTWPLAFTDELYGQIAVRSEIGAEAGFTFQRNLDQYLDGLTARVNDPATTAAERASAKKELADLQKNPTITFEVETPVMTKVDGVDKELTVFESKTMNLKEFIEYSINKAFDADGRLIDPRAAEELEAILLRDPFTSRVGQFVEKAFNSWPILRWLQPILRIPINGTIRSLEQIPGMQLLIRDPQSIYSDLKGLNGPRREIEARGRMIVGTAISSAAWMLASYGLTTGEEDQNPIKRKNAQTAGSTQGYNTKVGDGWYALGQLEAIGMPFRLASNFHQTMRNYEMRPDNAEKWVQHLFAASAYSVAASFRDIPLADLLKDAAALIKTIDKIEDDPGAGGRRWEQFVQRQISSFIPAYLRGANRSYDPTLLDPKGETIGQTVLNIFKAEFGMRDEVPRAYDVLGRPMQPARSLRPLIGIFAPLDARIQDKEQFVVESIKRIEDLTSRAIFALAPTPFGLPKVDLREYPSSIGNRNVAETYFKNYEMLKDGNGQTVSEALYVLFRGAEMTPSAIGNMDYNGPLTTDALSTVRRFQKMAWEVTLIQEGPPGTRLNTEVKKVEQIKLNARDPRQDAVISPFAPGFAR